MHQEDTSQRAGGEKAAWNIPFLNPTSKFTLMQELEAAQEGRAAAAWQLGRAGSAHRKKKELLKGVFVPYITPWKKTGRIWVD